ncbi:MAG: hypothetical protein RQ741_07510 [Wenzhouxiangellaceae bacterium]|nr:hypothetical protein [Wenzhouxiangellaceae bacterium]
MIRELFTNWRFRSTRPTLGQGQVIEVYLTGFDPDSGKGQVRIGDSLLEVDGMSPDQVDQLVRLEVQGFDADTATGTARPLDQDPASAQPDS